METTTLTLKNKYGECSVSINQDDLSIDTAIDELIRPILIASGYEQETVDSYLGGIKYSELEEEILKLKGKPTCDLSTI